MDIHQSVWKKFWHGFDGVECRGRVKWKDWVDETGDKRVRRKLAGL